MKHSTSNIQHLTKNKKSKNLLSVICYLLSERKGFTLLELLVVISIIALLIAMGITSFTTVQKKARDSKRKSDVKEIQQALEQYYSVCGYKYPTPTTTYYTNINCSSPAISIMPTVPFDPRATPYSCSSCTSTTYTVCAALEAETPNTFCISNQQ
jgi:general secretion pathway protein G